MYSTILNQSQFNIIAKQHRGSDISIDTTELTIPLTFFYYPLYHYYVCPLNTRMTYLACKSDTGMAALSKPSVLVTKALVEDGQALHWDNATGDANYFSEVSHDGFTKYRKITLAELPEKL